MAIIGCVRLINDYPEAANLELRAQIRPVLAVLLEPLRRYDNLKDRIEHLFLQLVVGVSGREQRRRSIHFD